MIIPQSRLSGPEMRKLIRKFDMIAVFDTASNASVASLKASVTLSLGSWGGIFFESSISACANKLDVFDLNFETSSNLSYNISLALVDETCSTFSNVIYISISLLPKFTAFHVKETSSKGDASASNLDLYEIVLAF